MNTSPPPPPPPPPPLCQRRAVQAIALSLDDDVAWVAEVNDFADATQEELLARLGGLAGDGTIIPDAEEAAPPPPSTGRRLQAAALPANFDARTKWPNYIHAIRDQQSCGSNWAFAASEFLSDRFAIMSNGTTNVVLSPEDLVSCDTTNQGCNGGYLNK